nr:hypothetical protein Iba_chr09bCG3320 [Ipomoea batatas]
MNLNPSNLGANLSDRGGTAAVAAVDDDFPVFFPVWALDEAEERTAAEAVAMEAAVRLVFFMFLEISVFSIRTQFCFVGGSERKCSGKWGNGEGVGIETRSVDGDAVAEIDAVKNGFCADFHGETLGILVPDVSDFAHLFDYAGEEGFDREGPGGVEKVGFSSGMGESEGKGVGFERVNRNGFLEGERGKPLLGLKVED